MKFFTFATKAIKANFADDRLVISPRKDFTDLPTELLLKIFSYLSQYDLQNSMLLINRRSYSIINTFFLKTLYTKYCRFEYWQSGELKKIERDIRQIQSYYKVSFFHEPDTHIGLSDLLLNKMIPLFLLAPIYVAVSVLYHVCSPGYNIGAHSDSMLVLECIGLIVFTLWAINQLGKKANENYQYKLLINTTALTKISTLKHKHTLLATEYFSTYNFNNLSNVWYLQNTLERTVQEIKEMAKDYQTEIKKIALKGFCTEINSSQLPEKLRDYSIFMNKRWNQETGKTLHTVVGPSHNRSFL